MEGTMRDHTCQITWLLQNRQVVAPPLAACKVLCFLLACLKLRVVSRTHAQPWTTLHTRLQPGSNSGKPQERGVT